MAPDPGARISGDDVHQFLEMQIADEQARRASLEQRGIGLLTSSGALVTTLGLAVGIVQRGDGLVGRVPVGFFAIVFAALLLAFSFGIAANIPRGYLVADEDAEDGLLGLLSPDVFWAPASKVSRRLTEERLDELTQMRRVNGKKASLVQSGQISQLAGLIWASVIVIVAST